MNSSCFLRASSATVKPCVRAAVSAKIGTPWLWQAKHVLCETWPSAPFFSKGSALATAAFTSAGSAGRAAPATSSERTQTATARNMTCSPQCTIR